MARRPAGAGLETKSNHKEDNDTGRTPADGGAPPLFQELADDRPSRVELPCVSVSSRERAQLLRWVQARTSPHRLVVRSRIILLASDGVSARSIAARLHVAPATVRLWCTRFSQKGVGSLERDAPGRGRRPGMSPDKVRAVLEEMQTRPPGGGTWTARALAARTRTSTSTVWRVWKRCHVGPASAPDQLARALAKAISEKG